MKHYCQTILIRLQQESDILRNMPITLDVTNEVENGSTDVKTKNIKVNPQYISKPKVAVSTIAHELAHIVYHELYGFKRNKEDEIFADVYGMILCKRAGFDITDMKDEWKCKLKRMENTNEHPQNQIRYLILKRVEAYLDDFNTIKINNQSARRSDYEEAPFDITFRRDRSRKAFGIEDDDKRTTKANAQELLRANISTDELKQKIMTSDLLTLCQNDLHDLSEKICKRALFQDYDVIEKMHNALTQSSFESTDNKYKEDIISLENQMIQELMAMQSQQIPQVFRKKVEVLLWHKNRFTSPLDRKQLQNWYVKSLLKQYGKDDGSEQYTADLSENLSRLHNKLHNADVLPLLRNIRDMLKLKEHNLPLLQSFAQQNNQETKQIRMEILATECLLSIDQAVKTVRYLSSNKLEPFRYEGFHGEYWYNDYTRKSEPLMTVSFIDEETLKEIHDDLANITPKKRAEIFSLLLESVGQKDGVGKLELFVDKKSKQDNLYKMLVDEYIKTYTQEQQGYVVASLISKKKLNKDYTYKDYFKTILENSGIDGIRVYNALYEDKKKEEIISLATNRTALHSQDMLIFANLRMLGQKMAQHSDLNLQKIGKKIMQATQKSIARPLKRECKA
ncbi:MAG: hypothetical protein IJ099_03990 [Alphaproteobacteria bacterium]|nr:hypothetical protein [Alphaproteobacteria bacterium]